MAPAQESPYYVPQESTDAWNQDPFATQQSSGYETPSPAQGTYEQPSYESSYQTSSPAPNYAGLEEPVTKGEWALCYFLMMIPCVGIIMMFVWAFSSTEKKSKSNFFKVQLIFMGIIFVLYLLLFLFALFMGIAFA